MDTCDLPRMWTSSFNAARETEAALLCTLEEFGAYWIGDEIDPGTGLEITYPISMDYLRSHPLLMLGTTFGYDRSV